MANLEFCGKHNMVAYLKKPTGSEGFLEIVDFLNGSHIRYALTKNPTIYVSLIKKFWQTATVRIVDNRDQEITATIDGKEFTITEASVRRHLQLADVDGISVLPTTEIFDQLSLMGYVLTDDKLTFQKGKFSPHNMKRGFSGEHTPLFPSMIAIQAEEGEGLGHPSEPQPPPSTAQPTNEEPIPNVDDRVERATTTPASLDVEQASGNINRTQSTAMPNVPLPQGIGAGGSPRCQEAIGGSIAQTRSERVPTQSYDSPLPRVHTLGSDEGSMTLQELTVKKLEKTVKSNQARRRAKIMVLDDEKDLEDSSKQGRMIEEIDQDAGVTLVTPTHSQEDQPEDYTSSGGISTTSRLFSTAKESVSTVGASMAVSTAGMVQEVNINIPSPIVIKDKGKGKMEEYKDEQIKRTKLQQEQDMLSHEAVEEWENIRARVEVDEELSRRLQAEERNKYNEVDQANMLVDLINQRKKYFAAQKAEAKRNKPMTQAQQRNYMINYIKHIGKVRSSKRDAEAELDHEGSKRQKTNEASGSVQEQPKEEEKELSQEDLQQMMMVVPVEEVYVEALQVKYLIIDWEVYTEEDDLVMLWNLVKERFSSTEPTNDKERALWVELKMFFKPYIDDTLWKLQRYIHDPLKWRLYDTCGVHHVST
ncbi:hypothetical protein Tco_0599510 [Tanacetum coccineum]